MAELCRFVGFVFDSVSVRLFLKWGSQTFRQDTFGPVSPPRLCRWVVFCRIVADLDPHARFSTSVGFESGPKVSDRYFRYFTTHMANALWTSCEIQASGIVAYIT